MSSKVKAMNAISWITENLNQNEISSETLQSVGDFTLMWAIFEASEGEERNNMPVQINRFANRIYSQVPVEIIDAEFLYWKDRYFCNNRETEHLNNLRFSDHEQKELALATFKSLNPSLKDKLKTCLFIVYRYRNNLFHGMKDIRLLNGQQENFSNATSFLQKVLPYGRAHFLGFPHDSNA